MLLKLTYVERGGTARVVVPNNTILAKLTLSFNNNYACICFFFVFKKIACSICHTLFFSSLGTEIIDACNIFIIFSGAFEQFLPRKMLHPGEEQKLSSS